MANEFAPWSDEFIAWVRRGGEFHRTPPDVIFSRLTEWLMAAAAQRPVDLRSGSIVAVFSDDEGVVFLHARRGAEDRQGLAHVLRRHARPGAALRRRDCRLGDRLERRSLAVRTVVFARHTIGRLHIGDLKHGSGAARDTRSDERVLLAEAGRSRWRDSENAWHATILPGDRRLATRATSRRRARRRQADAACGGRRRSRSPCAAVAGLRSSTRAPRRGRRALR